MKPLPALPPRGSLLSTGEDTAARNSAKGRSLLVQVARGERENPSTGSVDYATLRNYLRTKSSLLHDRGRKDRLDSVPPPSEPYGRISRIRLSG